MRNRIVLSTFIFALTALTVWFMWPIYQDPYLFVSVALGLGVGLGISWLQASRKLSPLTTALNLLIAFVVLSLPATNPRAIANPGQLLSGWIEALISPVNTWKQLVTVELPVGTYHALLAPAFLSYLIAGAVFGWVFFGPISRFWAVVYPVLGLVIVSISFGTATVPGDFELLGLQLPIATPLVAGGLIFVTVVAYLNWGSKTARKAALTNKAEAPLPLLSGWQRKLRRNLSAIAVVAIALVGTGIFMQSTGVSGTRIVLRTDIEKLKNIQKQTSPLSTYRKYFNDSTLLDQTLLTYSIKGAPDRIRIATMPFYDGDNFTVAPTKSTSSADSYYFARVPSDLPTTGKGKEQSFSIKLGKLDSIWLPLAAHVRKISFNGTNALQLSDSLFVNRETATGAIIPGNSNDALYTVTYNNQAQPDPAEISPGGGAIANELIPESLLAWIENQSDIPGDSGSGVIQLANRLRDRGYLSHSFVAPVGAAGVTTWMDKLNNYEFFQSNAGHNMARISTMFTEINAREQDAKSKNSKNLVSTAGDDEQFATAIALIASAKGYQSRVVIGFRTGNLDDLPGVETCKAISDVNADCKGSNLSAWAEIRGKNDEWLAIDSTPQFTKKMNLLPIGTAYIPNPTESGEDDAKVLPPAKATPSSDSECRKHPDTPDCNPDDFWAKVLGFITNYVVPVLITLFVGGVFAAPFVFVLFMKRNRRRSRIEAPEPEVRVIGAWEEYIDLLVDNGQKLPGSETRKELAALYGSENLDELAELADLAAFSPRMPTDEEIERAWEIFEVKNQEVLQESKLWGRIKARLSLRSFLRNVNPKQELLRLRNTLNFTQGNKASEGSAVEGLTIEFKRQLKSVFQKKSK
ncbi:MAG: hypothetical protein RLY83_184 [Actinomycetota bacterium]|jgi:hypothetical protein